MTTNTNSRRFLLLLLVIAAGLLALVLAPLLGALFAAAVFAAVLRPVQSRLKRRFGGREHLAATVLTSALTLGLLVPIGWGSVVVVRQVAGSVQGIVEVVEQRGLDGLVEQLPERLQPYAFKLEQSLPEGALPGRMQVREPGGAPRQYGAEATGPKVVGWGLQAVADVMALLLEGLGGFLLELGVLIVAFYVMLSEGHLLVAWIRRVAPLSAAQVDTFVKELHDVTSAVFLCTVLTALLQAAVASIGYGIAGLPHLVVWTLATFAFAFIPAVGGAAMTAAIGGYHLLTGDVSWGVFLLVWAVLAVGVVDNVATPWLAQRRLQLPGSVLFFAMIGGVAAFGVMGVVAGPLVVAFFLVVLRALEAGQPTAATVGS
jgi:predicted PurR-regulated permease PerM